MELFEKKTDGKEIFNGRVITVREDTVLLPDGNSAKREIVHHNGGVCVAALDDEDRLAFVRQFRYAYGKVLLELPAGKLEKGEDPFDAVRRELKEEVGAEGRDWRKLGELYPSPGYTDEIIRLYTCRISSMGETHLDEDEFLTCEFIPLETAAKMVMDGEIEDSKSQVLILKLLTHCR